MANFNFKCPYCNQSATITDPDMDLHWRKLYLEKPEVGETGLLTVAITCPNKSCNKLILKISHTKAVLHSGNWRQSCIISEWKLLPESSAKVLPDYIPEPIKNDYFEACRIKDLSPKASATLSRRCLQGMIRDFWEVKKSSLKDEIDAIEEKVDSLTWDAINSVRKVGNIGAHMEKDINMMINVDPKEAQLLIELIEQLVDDWYIERHNKKERLIKIKLLAEEKDSVKKNIKK